MSSYLLALSGQAINLAGLVSPPAAGRMAFRLFCRTGRREPGSDKEKRLFAISQAQMRQAKTSLLTTAAGFVAAHRFPPIGPANGKRYLLVHGWGSRIDYVQGLISGLRQGGAEVIGLDLPGHGRSSGNMLTVPMAIDAIDAAWREFGTFDAMIGHSFGGFVSTMAATGPAGWLPTHTPARLVVIAAPVTAKFIFDKYARRMRFRPDVHRAMEEAVNSVTGRPVEFYAVDRMLATRPDLPVLVLQAEDDKEVPAEAARRYAAAGPHVRLEWLNGLGHRRIVNSQATIDLINSFLG